MGWGKWSRGRCGSLEALGARNEGGRRSVHGERRLAGLGARRRGNSGGFWATRSGWEAALGRGAANGGGDWGGAGLWWRLRGGVSSPAFKRGGGGVLRCDSEGNAKEKEEWISGALVVLGRSLEEGGGFCSVLATATARWRRRGRFWARRRAWHGRGGLQREATGGGGGAEQRVGASAKQRDGREGSPRRRRAALSVGSGEKQSREVGEGDKGRFAISENSRDHSVNKQ